MQAGHEPDVPYALIDLLPLERTAALVLQAAGESPASPIALTYPVPHFTNTDRVFTLALTLSVFDAGAGAYPPGHGISGMGTLEVQLRGGLHARREGAVEWTDAMSQSAEQRWQREAAEAEHRQQQHKLRLQNTEANVCARLRLSLS